LNPNQTAIPEALSGSIAHFRDGQLVVLRSTVFPGVTALVEKTFVEHGLSVDTAFCPERIAEGKAMTSCSSSRRSSPGAPRGDRARRTAVPAADRADRRGHPGRGRVREAVHERVAVHQVRRREPVLHDGERPRGSTSEGPARDHLRLPARGRHARGRVRRGSLPVQGHHAAHRGHGQQLRPRRERDAGQRGPAAVT